MTIIPKKGILLVKKLKNSQLKTDIIVEETDNDKALITGEVLASKEAGYEVGDKVIFGKYSLFELVLQGENYYFIDADDVIGVYSEK
jgi:co-chaperonin GroES (HSP10)